MNEGQAIVKSGGATIKSLIQGEQFKLAVAQALPKHLTADRFIRTAITAMTRTPKLAECDQASFFGALMTLSSLGIEPDGRRAHLIPFENKRRGVTEVQLIIDYKGIVDLVMRSGTVSNLHADVVCEHDVFTVDRGEIKEHKVDYRKPRGEVYAAYALCRFKDGSEKSEVMSLEEIESIRKRSRAGNSGPWVTDWREMAVKTVFRRLSKWLPFSPEQRDAVEADDNQFETPTIEVAKPIFGITKTVDTANELPEPITASPDGMTEAEKEAALKLEREEAQ